MSSLQQMGARSYGTTDMGIEGNPNCSTKSDEISPKKLEQFDRDLVSNRLLSRSPITAESTEAISENKLGQRFTLVRELLSFNIM